MKTSRFFSFISLLVPAAVFLLSGSAMAVPAAPDPIIVTQPDGTMVEVYNRGDERQNWMETGKGHTIARDARTKKWHYVDHFQDQEPVLSTVPAHKKAPAGLKKHLRPSRRKAAEQQTEKPDQSGSSENAEPTSGSPSASALTGSLENAPTGSSGEVMSGKVLFILIEFGGESPVDPAKPAQAHTYSASEWSNFLSDNIADFFTSASYGRSELGPAQETDGVANDGIIGWITLPQGHPGAAKEPGDEDWTNSEESREIATAAIEAADDFIDYAAYDANNDGYVDADELAVTIVVAGYENSVGGDAYLPTVWGHKYALSTPVTTEDQNAAGTNVVVGAYHNKAGGYAIFGEVHQSTATNGHQATMGIMVHELGHLIFGFPDLYDTDGSSSGIGAYCVMSGGSWGRAAGELYSGQTPVLPSAWIKHFAGWVTPVSSCGSHSLTAAGDDTANAVNTVSRVMTPAYPDQYFLIENRQPVGYDRGLQRYLGSSFGGLAVFHIDDAQSDNRTDAHRKVDLEEADGEQLGASSGTATKLWFNGQTANLGGFSAASNPNSALYDSTASGVTVTDISNSGTVMDATMTANQEYCYPDGILLYEDFDGATPHKGWTVVNNGANGKEWLYSSPRIPAQSNYTGGGGNYAVADGWYYYALTGAGYNSELMDTELRSPFFDASNYRTVDLSFKSNVYSDETSNRADVAIRCAGDDWQWHEVWNRDGQYFYQEDNPVIDITQYTSASSGCQIRFRYSEAFLFHWQIDDIAVQGILSQTGFEGSAYSLPANQWRLISLPREPENGNTVSDLFSDDFAAAPYWSDWILYKRNTGTTAYSQLELTSPLELGKGYWIYSNNEATLDVPGLPTVAVYNDDCPAGCFEIPLSEAASGGSLFNMVGNPFSRSVKWADVKFRVQKDGTSTVYDSPVEADADGYVSNTGYTYNGSAWQAFDDVTPGMLGTINEFDGFLVKVLDSDFDALTLLVPASEQTENTSQFAARETGGIIRAATATSGWSVRLTAEDAGNHLIDSGNVLGLLPDSVLAYDRHDLKELAPMGGDYLTVVFPHPEWGANSGDYTSDYRKFRASDGKIPRVMKWRFEVRTNDPQRTVTISWSGLPVILKRSVIIDSETGKVIRPNVEKSYTFTMNGTSRAFIWKKK